MTPNLPVLTPADLEALTAQAEKAIPQDWTDQDGLRVGSCVPMEPLEPEVVLALVQMAKSAAWQPIASAPKDGRVVLGWDPARDAVDVEGDGHGVIGVEFMRWRDGYWMDPATYSMKPTHWQPLPPAPREEPEP